MVSNLKSTKTEVGILIYMWYIHRFTVWKYKYGIDIIYFKFYTVSENYNKLSVF